MEEVTSKPENSNIVMEQPTPSMQPAPSTKQEEMETSCEPKYRNSNKVLKISMRVKVAFQRNSRKKSSLVTTTSSKKPKRTRRPILFGHYHRLNEKLNQSDRDQETLENSTTSSNKLCIK
ncbi:uncharacterized protein LOC143670830 [Tamandua tetradactyla]|uniref:uncharacterized protein LOC143670830 n=1 Tax=Tamandua tetradactyla TaxID=48850 RepID=UPI004053A564